MQTTHLALQLPIKRTERSAEPTLQKASELQAFFTNWERILAAETEQLNRL